MEKYFADNYSDGWVLNIQSISSFYNYRTVGDDFRLATSILSNQERLLDIKLTKSAVLQKTLGFQVIDEVVLNEEDISSRLSGLCVKQARINSAMLKIRLMDEQENNEQSRLFDYFALRADAGENVNIENEASEDTRPTPAPENIVRQEHSLVRQDARPIYCRYRRAGKKAPCSDCKSPCTFTLEMILSERRAISQSDIIDELRLHHHPSSRKIQLDANTTRMRLTNEAAEELAQHYIHFHNKKPINW